jgi:hypothetical protein
MTTPAIDAVTLADRGDIFRSTIDHCKAVEMTTILRRQLADELGLPDCLEAMGLAELGEAGILGVDEHHLAIAADAKLMDVEIANGLGVARHIALVELTMDDLVRTQDVLEPPQLVQAPEIDALGITNNPHRALEDALEERDASLLVAADQIDAPGLVRRNRQ